MFYIVKPISPIPAHRPPNAHHRPATKVIIFCHLRLEVLAQRSAAQPQSVSILAPSALSRHTPTYLLYFA